MHFSPPKPCQALEPQKTPTIFAKPHMSSLAITKNGVRFSNTRDTVTHRVTAESDYSLAFWQMLRCYATAPPSTPSTPSTFLGTLYEMIFVESSRLLGGVGGVGGEDNSQCSIIEHPSVR